MNQDFYQRKDLTPLNDLTYMSESSQNVTLQEGDLIYGSDSGRYVTLRYVTLREKIPLRITGVRSFIVRTMKDLTLFLPLGRKQTNPFYRSHARLVPVP